MANTAFSARFRIMENRKRKGDRDPNENICVDFTPEEARKAATKSDAVSKAKARAARNLDYDMPKPRVQITEVSRASSKLSGKGGGGMMSPVKTPADSSRMSMPLKKKMNRGGVVKKVRK